MENSQFITDFFQAANLFNLLIKVGGIILSFIFMIFAWVMVKQVRLMRELVQMYDGGWLLLVARVQLIIALILFIYAIFIL